MLYNLGVREVKILKEHLSSQRLLRGNSNTDEIRADINVALELVNRVEPIQSLKDLARCAIICSMSRKGLFGYPDLGLPKVLQNYVLLEF